jgi:NADH-quinone oxidoreductase subunit C/D
MVSLENFTRDENGAFILPKEEIYATISILKDEGYGLLLDITGIDYLTYSPKPQKRFSVVYLLRHLEHKEHLCLKVFLGEDEGITSLTPLYEAANWAEREVWDQYGIVFKGHPNLKRILNHHEFKGHPLRKDYPVNKGQWCEETDDLMDQMNARLELKKIQHPQSLTYLNIGPAHPATHGTIRNLVALEGESIISCVSEIGYLHRGFEKACENHTYNQIIPYTDRLNYCSAILNNIGFVHTVEGMLGVTIPERGEYLRVIIGELSRAIDHLVCLAAILVDMGALTNYWYLYNPREAAYTLLSKLTGARLTNSYMRVGGMAHDTYEGFEEELEEVLKAIESGVSDALALVEHNRIFHDRTQNVGVMSAQDALNFGWTGPNLRASGVAYDMRSNLPYSLYERFEFSVPVGSVGDVYDRIMVRFEEITQSIHIIRQAITQLPDGPVSIQNPRITLPPKESVYTTIEGLMNQFKLTFEGVHVPKGEYYRAIEGANGELGFYIVSDGRGTPYKVKVRPPCFPAMAGYAKLVEGGMIADAILCLGSLNIIAGELDR